MENTISDCYKSISAIACGVYKDNGSRFLSFAYPVQNEEEVKNILSSLKKEYYDARHHCYAYRIGYKGDNWRINDDGEPSSTAGKPIYGQILSNELSDILIVVVRYFGGIKLGVPGLIKAYKTASAEAISAATIITKTASEPFEIQFSYEQTNSVMKLLREMEVNPKEQKFDNLCTIVANVRLRDVERFAESMGKIATVQKIQTIKIL